MRIVVANVNTTASMTESIARRARRVAAPGTEIVAITPAFGPASVEGNYEGCVAAVAVAETLKGYHEAFDAVVLAGFGEPGREALQELLEVPIVDITEAAAATAMLLGRAYSVVTTLDRAVPMIEDRLKLAGLYARCASVRATDIAVLELERDPAAAVDAVVAAAKRAVGDDRAEVICLGCAGMAGLAQDIAVRVGVPVVDGVGSAVKLAEGLVAQGLKTSKVRSYAAPRSKPFTNWPPRW